MNPWIDIVITIIVITLAAFLIWQQIVQSKRGGQCSSCRVKVTRHKSLTSKLITRYRKKYQH